MRSGGSSCGREDVLQATLELRANPNRAANAGKTILVVSTFFLVAPFVRYQYDADANLACEIHLPNRSVRSYAVRAATQRRSFEVDVGAELQEAVDKAISICVDGIADQVGADVALRTAVGAEGE